MLCLSGFELYSRWVPLLLRLCLMRVIIGREGNWSENCVLVNLKMTIYNTLSSAAWWTRWSKLLKKPTFATVIEISKGDQRSLLQSIDHLLNREFIPRFLAESFKNFFANKIEPIRAQVTAMTTPPSLENCCDDNPHEFTNFLPVSSKKISDLVSFKVESCDVHPVLRLYWNLVCLC